VVVLAEENILLHNQDLEQEAQAVQEEEVVLMLYHHLQEVQDRLVNPLNQQIQVLMDLDMQEVVAE
jgi:hypothetical protein